MDLSSSRAVVTGGASGIGRGLVLELASDGCRVLVADIDGDRARAVAEEAGAGAVGVKCDVSNHDDVVALARFAKESVGEIDLVFANAGVSVGGPILDATPQAVDWIFGVNVRGTWNTISVFGQRIRDEGRPGHICLTGSEHSLGMQHPGIGLYTATKMAVLGLGDVLRAELPESVKVSVFCPGLVATELHLSKRYGPLPPDPDAMLAFTAAVMARGMDARTVARAAVDGVMAGRFLIVTHPAALAAAESRHEEILAAFAKQAPWSPAADDYRVDRVTAAVGREWAERR